MKNIVIFLLLCFFTFSCGEDCDSECPKDTSGDLCGNGEIDNGESCDASALGGESCASQGFDGGTLACAADCGGFDTSGCFVCGDDVIGGAEVCDGADLSGENCVSQGFDGGNLGCAADCTGFDTTGCHVCGDNAIGGTEVCDGSDLGGETCVSQGFSGGTLGCAADCTDFDVTSCTSFQVFCSTPGLPIGPSAGTVTTDTIVVPALGEYVTDVNVFVDATHTWLSDLEVQIRHVESDTQVMLLDNQCSNNNDINATFDQDAAGPPDCVAPIAVEGSVLPAGNLDKYLGMIDAQGTWELTILDMANGDGGTLAEWCVEFETSTTAPTETCGDGVITFNETCDGADLNGQTCSSLGWLGGGTLACNPTTCAYDTAACVGPECGNSSISAPEVCDTNELGGLKCEDLGFVGGSLDCSFPTCGFDTSECSNNVIAVCLTPGLFLDDWITSTVTLFDLGTVGDIDVFVNLTHTWVSDVDMYLVHNATGTTVELSTDQCSAGDDIWAFYNDEGNGLPDCVAPLVIEGNITPEGQLSDFDGLPIAGDWTLQITDDFPAIDDGLLVQWCIYIRPN